jgi:surface polysaccharide O-acyltransferase-like enzyme
MRNYGIDLFRIIGAFLIILLHCQFGNFNNEIVSSIRLSIRWVVPFFLLTTGYFLADKIEDRGLSFIRIKNNILKLISLILISNITFLPIGILQNSILLQKFHNGFYFHLWFLNSMFIGYIVIYLFYYLNLNKYLFNISIILLLLLIYADAYSCFFNIKIDFESIKVLISIPFMYFGIMINKRIIVGKRFFILFLIIGLIVQIIESYYLNSFILGNNSSYQILFGTIILSISIFIISSNLRIRNIFFSIIGNKYSLFIYLYHPIFIVIVGKLIKKTFPYIFEINFLFPIIVFFATLIFAIISDKYFTNIFRFFNGDLTKIYWKLYNKF